MRKYEDLARQLTEMVGGKVAVSALQKFEKPEWDTEDYLIFAVGENTFKILSGCSKNGKNGFRANFKLEKKDVVLEAQRTDLEKKRDNNSIVREALEVLVGMNSHLEHGGDPIRNIVGGYQVFHKDGEGRMVYFNSNLY